MNALSLNKREPDFNMTHSEAIHHPRTYPIPFPFLFGFGFLFCSCSFFSSGARVKRRLCYGKEARR